MNKDGLRDSGPSLWVMLRIEGGGKSEGEMLVHSQKLLGFQTLIRETTGRKWTVRWQLCTGLSGSFTVVCSKVFLPPSTLLPFLPPSLPSLYEEVV